MAHQVDAYKTGNNLVGRSLGRIRPKIRAASFLNLHSRKCLIINFGPDWPSE